MSKFGCTCGNTISDVHCPNEVTGYLLSDKSGEEIFNLICSTIDDYMNIVLRTMLMAGEETLQ